MTVQCIIILALYIYIPRPFTGTKLCIYRLSTFCTKVTSISYYNYCELLPTSLRLVSAYINYAQILYIQAIYILHWSYMQSMSSHQIWSSPDQFIQVQVVATSIMLACYNGGTFMYTSGWTSLTWDLVHKKCIARSSGKRQWEIVTMVHNILETVTQLCIVNNTWMLLKS